MKALCRRLPACETFAIDAIAVYADTLFQAPFGSCVAEFITPWTEPMNHE